MSATEDRTFREVKRQFRNWQQAQDAMAERARPKSREELRDDMTMKYGQWMEAGKVYYEALRELKRAIRRNAPDTLQLLDRVEKAERRHSHLWGDYLQARVRVGWD